MTTPIGREALEQALRSVMDPEVGVNVYDLGLIYDVLAGDRGDLRVRMTMTTPACPVGSLLAEQVGEALRELPGVGSVEVELVWDPPWSPELMKPAARRQLGW
jgi:metal-sulfur cluster biosynthetic enzyme